ncbi:hypothetical protein D3C79_944540 [compost metagenome]
MIHKLVSLIKTCSLGLLDNLLSLFAGLLQSLLLFFYISDRLLSGLSRFIHLLHDKFTALLHDSEQFAECKLAEQEIQDYKCNN